MTERKVRKVERLHKRRFFILGLVVTSIVLLIASLGGFAASVFGVDPRPFVAVLPVAYAVVLIAGVAWLAWATRAPHPAKDRN